MSGFEAWEVKGVSCMSVTDTCEKTCLIIFVRQVWAWTGKGTGTGRVLKLRKAV